MLPSLTRHKGRLGLLALTALLAAVPASAQEDPARPEGPVARPAVPVGGWSGYRPDTAWGPGRIATAPATRGRGAVATYYVSQSGWVTCAPPSAETQSGLEALRISRRLPNETPVKPSGWASYDPATSWRAYILVRGVRESRPIAARPPIMQLVRVSGPSPYSDGLARAYYEYGTGRPVPVAKPWLPGSP